MPLSYRDRVSILSRSIDGLSPGLGVITGKADVDDSNPAAVNPGGVPLFKNGPRWGELEW